MRSALRNESKASCQSWRVIGLSKYVDFVASGGTDEALSARKEVASSPIAHTNCTPEGAVDAFAEDGCTGRARRCPPPIDRAVEL